MSGFVGLLELDGAPLDRALLNRLTAHLEERGPDRQQIWSRGSVGFGHALLGTDDSTDDCQPFSLGGKYWIVGDFRVDGRSALMADLDRRDLPSLSTASDAELILRSYEMWAERCVEHLIGDFAFAVWDSERRRLFCARDQLGVKPFYFARCGKHLIFSNTLDCIRQHPAISDRLNDLAIADFLLFDFNQEPSATSFRDIQRIPPAHTLTWQGENIRLRRYWTLPVPSPARRKHKVETVEEFRELFGIAVADRLRTSKAAVLMSGGLDSTSVAVSAKTVLGRENPSAELRAYTEVFDSLIPHEERYYAGLVAKRLAIPIRFHANDHVRICQHASETALPEPVHSPASDEGSAQLREVAGFTRVVLTGYGGDPSLSCLLSKHFRQLLGARKLGRILADIFAYLGVPGRSSRLYLRTRWGRWFGSTSTATLYPQWLNPELEKRLSLGDRWRAMNEEGERSGGPRDVAYNSVRSSGWPALFESCDFAFTRTPLEIRHPFFDLRLLNFLLSLPALPWCSDKQLLREATRGVLPERVRLRRKSPLIMDPLIALLRQPESHWVDSFEAVPQLGDYVQRSLVPNVSGENDGWSAWMHLRPLSLNCWLRQQKASGIHLKGAAHDLQLLEQEAVRSS